MALAGAEREKDGEGRLTAIFGLVGAVNLPIIHYSVLWWRTLHQGQSISFTGSTIDSSILWPLPLTMIGFTAVFGAVVMMRMRAELAENKLEARMRRAAAE
jgi:heme exporter protein C